MPSLKNFQKTFLLFRLKSLYLDSAEMVCSFQSIKKIPVQMKLKCVNIKK